MTTSPAVLAFSLLIITIQADPFNALAIPEQQLPGGCRIVAAPGSPELGLRAGRWGALPIDANPWRGTDRIAVAAIRERMDPPQMVPDGPPLHPRDLAAFRRNLADGAEQAYAAIYESADRQQVGNERQLLLLDLGHGHFGRRGKFAFEIDHGKRRIRGNHPAL